MEARRAALRSWLGKDMAFPAQSANSKVPLKLPVRLRFGLKSPHQSKEKSGTPVICVLLGVSE